MIFNHPDGGEILADIYPIDFAGHENKPILFFLYGVFGYEKSAYIQALLVLMKKYDWRGVFLNRRGFHTQELKTE